MLRHQDDIDAVIICSVESCEAASTVQYCTPQGKFFSLSGDLEGDDLLSELSKTRGIEAPAGTEKRFVYLSVS